MAAIYSNLAKAARMQATADLLNGGKLEIGTAGMATVLATFTLANPSGSVVNGLYTINMAPDLVATASATGAAAAARLRTSANADVVTGLTVGTSAADVILSSTSINSGQTVTLADGTITHA